jgi:hypothetical protein
VTSFADAAAGLARGLPQGSRFEFEEGGRGEYRLMLLDLPRAERGRGRGTRFMAALVAAADEAGATLRLEADSTDEPGDPSTFQLARWYARFGFRLRGITDPDEWVEMARQPRPPGRGLAGAIEDYEAARALDLRDADFDAWRVGAAVRRP